MYKRADEPILEKLNPYDDRHRWIRNWCGHAVLSNKLTGDLLNSDDREEEEGEEENEDETDFGDFSESDEE